MKLIQTKLDGVFIIEPYIFGDARGWFYESYSKEKFTQLGITADFIQDNHAYSEKKGTLRGLHYQKEPFAQSKLVRCTKGSILDVAVDIRKGSPSYSKWVSAVLSEDNKQMLFVPKGFAHGYITLTDGAEVQYKVDAYYSPQNDRGIRCDDPAIGVDWGADNYILSDKDSATPLLKDADNDFIWREDS